MDTISRYQFYKNKWEGIKPIRGRAVDTRPIGKRSRDNELLCRNITQAADGSTVESYACRLYNTDVVEYMPNEDIVLRTGDGTSGWNSPLTATFIHNNTPFFARKIANRIWVKTAGELLFPLPDNGRAVTFRMTQHPASPERCVYMPIDMPLLFRRVVDRTKAKEARLPLKPFLDWAKAFLNLSDGWLMHETRKEAVPFRDVGAKIGEVALNDYPHFDYHRRYDIVEWAQHEEMFLPLLCHLLDNKWEASDSRIAETKQADTWHGGISFFDMRFSFKQVQAKVYNAVKNNMDVYKLVPVELKGKVIGDLVDG